MSGELRQLTRTIHRAAPADVNLVVEAITRAFVTLPPAVWLVPEGIDRAFALYKNFEIYVQHALEHGVVWTVPTFEAVAVWFPRDLPLPEIPAYDSRLAAATGPYVDRFRLFDRLLDARHPATPHHHLGFLAVTPERQHQGLGTMLLTHHHEHLDECGVPAYLEASSLDSRRLYARHGYTDLGPPIELPDGPPLWPMWREPHLG